MSNSIELIELNWLELHQTLDEQGFAKLPCLLSPDTCRQLVEDYDQNELYRKTIDMARYRFGIGEYKYYQSPIPPVLQQLRNSFYPELAKAANRWLELLHKPAIYPDTLGAFLDQCHQAGQNRPTPLILKYKAGGYNCMHQDLYGDIYFPFQVLFVLNQRNDDYTGGESILLEQRPRAQSRGHVITLNQGEGLIFPTQHRPVQGTRGYYRATLRHGVGTVHSGTRYSAGIIFHDAI
ncbi:2OG-Fe(II) oxygenase [Paenibacillus agaridevorans]|uniref:2OG-Fe(II) oxygenase n=1 Tax=Paenibacillus agaridevorans TaxID=171404 RepID=UPI001BE4038B|nr:2OG-Fe(II) oxygenase [Paenibacillus agaridevorans]